MKKSASKTFPLLIFLFLSNNLILADIGSDSSVTRFTTQQPVNDGERIAGFAALKAGFALASSTVTGMFDSFFEVSGDVALNGGTLDLQRDLIFRSISGITSLGNIDGNGYTLDFSSSITLVPTSASSGDFNIGLVDSESQSDDVESCHFSYDGKFVAIGLGADQSTHDVLRNYEFASETLMLRDSVLPDGTYGEIMCVRWHPSSYLLAVCRASVSGDDFLMYESDANGDLTKKDGIYLNGSGYAVDWHPTGDWVAVGQSNTANEIAVYAVSATGIITEPAVAIVNLDNSRVVQTQTLVWDQTGNYLAVGLNQSSGNADVIVYEFNQSSPSLTPNASVETGSTVLAVSWNKQNQTILAVGLEGSSGQLLRIYEHDSSGGTLTQRDSKSDLNANIRSLAWHPQGDILALGKNATTTDELLFYFYNSLTKKLSDEVASFDYANPVEALSWSPDGNYIATGNDSWSLDMYELTRATNGCVVFDDLEVLLNNDVTFDNCCITFAGECVINGRGNCLSLGSSCTFVVDSDSNLQLRDLTLKGIHDERFFCTDDSATFSFHDVEICLDNNYTFSLGSFDILADLAIVGESKTFAYQSSEASTIGACGRFILDEGITFRYAPPTTARTLVQFANSASEFVVNGATVVSTSTGLILSGGTLIFDGEPLFSSEGSVEAEGIVIASDMTVQWSPAALLDSEGPVVWQ